MWGLQQGCIAVANSVPAVSDQLLAATVITCKWDMVCGIRSGVGRRGVLQLSVKNKQPGWDVLTDELQVAIWEVARKVGLWAERGGGGEW